MRLSVKGYKGTVDLENIYSSLSMKTGKKPVMFYDIETAPLSEQEIRPFFDQTKVRIKKEPLPFDPSLVKYGNTKQEHLKQEKLHQARKHHLKSTREWARDCNRAVEEAWEDFMLSSTLRAETSRVAAIGYGVLKGREFHLHCDIRPDDEELMISDFFVNLLTVDQAGGRIVDFNGHSFDLPYLKRRAWYYKHLEVPALFNEFSRLPSNFIDIHKTWKMGNTRDSIKLANLARYFGLEGKLEGMTGDMFHKVLKEDYWTAHKYLQHDIFTLYECAARMGVVRSSG